jgi:hypothetical protein
VHWVLLVALLSITASEAAVERTFSRQGLIHSKLRNRLKDSTVQMQMFFSFNSRALDKSRSQRRKRHRWKQRRKREREKRRMRRILRRRRRERRGNQLRCWKRSPKSMWKNNIGRGYVFGECKRTHLSTALIEADIGDTDEAALKVIRKLLKDRPAVAAAAAESVAADVVVVAALNITKMTVYTVGALTR